MSNEPTFSEEDVINIARGFDAPAEPELLKKLQEQAQEREVSKEVSKDDLTHLRDILNEKQNGKERDNELER